MQNICIYICNPTHMIYEYNLFTFKHIYIYIYREREREKVIFKF